MALQQRHPLDAGAAGRLSHRWHPALLQQDEQVQACRALGPGPGVVWPGRVVGVQRQLDTSQCPGAGCEAFPQQSAVDMGHQTAASCLAAAEQLRMLGHPDLGWHVSMLAHQRQQPAMVSMPSSSEQYNAGMSPQQGLCSTTGDDPVNQSMH